MKEKSTREGKIRKIIAGVLVFSVLAGSLTLANGLGNQDPDSDEIVNEVLEEQEEVTAANAELGDDTVISPAADTWNGSGTASGFSGGTGTADDPYLIYTGAELAFLAQKVNAGDASYKSQHYKLMDDINLGGNRWTPIGTSGIELIYDRTFTSAQVNTTTAFSGVFYGNEKTITGLSVAPTGSLHTGEQADYKALFGCIESAQIYDLTILSSTIDGGSGVGTLVGYGIGDVIIDNCKITDTNITSSGGANIGTGGLVGLMDIGQNKTVKISNCVVENVNINSSIAYGKVGGLIGGIMSRASSASTAGNGNLTLENCAVKGGKVNASTYYYTGGFIGEIEIFYSTGNTVEVLNCNSSAEVTAPGTSGYYVGGLIGFTRINENSQGSKIRIEDCFATGDVSAGGTYVGGLIGYSENTRSDRNISTPIGTTVKNCYATGDVSTTWYEGANVGGFIGHCHAGDGLPEGTMLIENCYATGDVTATRGYNAGGFVARPMKNVIIRDCYATGDVYCKRIHGAGFVGFAEGSLGNKVKIYNCYSIGSVYSESYYTGGFVGFLQYADTYNCYSTGYVYSTGYSVGGFMGQGFYTNTVSNCYAGGAVRGTGINRGAFAGAYDSGTTIQNSYYDTTTTGGIAGVASGAGTGVTGLSTADMTKLSSYSSSWNMKDNYSGDAAGTGNTNNPWYIDNGATYPYLYYQYDGRSAEDTNYNLLSVSTPGNISVNEENRTDFTYSGGTVNFTVTTGGAARVYFPFNDAKNIFGNQNTIPVPDSGSASIAANSFSRYSLGGISASNIVAFAPGYSDPKLAITYNGNGGEPERDQDIVDPGDSVTLPDATWENYTFLGWFTEEIDGTRVGGAGDSYEPSESIELFAHWDRIQYTVTYNGNEGTPERTEDVVYAGESVTLPDAEREGYTFQGWYTAQTDGASVGEKGDSYRPTGNIELFARWEIRKYTVTFESNGGTAVASQSVEYQERATEPTAPTKDGFIFKGWYTDDGTFVNAYIFSTPVTADITLYAKWDDADKEIKFEGFDGEAMVKMKNQADSILTKALPKVLIDGEYATAEDMAKMTYRFERYTRTGGIGSYVYDWSGTVLEKGVDDPAISVLPMGFTMPSGSETDIIVNTKPDDFASGIVKLTIIYDGNEEWNASCIIIVPGDVDLNGYIRFADSELLQRFILDDPGVTLNDYPYQRLMADMDSESLTAISINPFDLARLEEFLS